MSSLILVIGNKNYSSWSMRPWLAMRQCAIPFEEVRIPLYQPGAAEQLAHWSPSGLVPALHDGEVRVWDSLAIGEYLHEKFPEKGLWPRDGAARALARSMSAEMHAGFSALRQAMFMNIRARYPGLGRTPESLKEVERIVGLWNGCRARFAGDGPFLFGGFTYADAMYAPVVLRFRTYGVELPGAAAAYAETMLALPAMREWIAGAESETERIDRFERD